MSRRSHRSARSSFLLSILLAAFLAPGVALGASLMPQGKQAYFDANGDPLAGGKVYTYAAGTSTPLETYSDQAGTTPNANPVVLDSRGEAPIFWGAGPYKVSLYTSADVLVWTQDNLYPPFTAGDALGAALNLYSGGNASTPELTWGDDTNSGFYLIGNDNIGLTLGGTKRWDFGAAGSTLTGTLNVSGATSLGSTLWVGGTITGTIAGPITDGLIVDADLAATTVTRSKLAPVGQQISGSSGTFSTSSASYVDVTNLSVSITTTGRPVHLFLQPDGSGSTANVQVEAGTSASIAILRDAAVIAEWSFVAADGANATQFGVGAVQLLDAPAAGTYAYKVQLKRGASGTQYLQRAKLVAFEL